MIRVTCWKRVVSAFNRHIPKPHHEFLLYEFPSSEICKKTCSFLLFLRWRGIREGRWFVTLKNYENNLIFELQMWHKMWNIMHLFCICIYSSKYFYFQKQSPGGVLLKEAVLKIVANFTRKRLCWSFFLIDLQTCNFIKKKLQVLSCEN